MRENEATEVIDVTVVAIRRLLRPLATAMMEVGLTFPMFNRLAREAFVEAALKDFHVDGKPSSQSRIAILSGVHRQEVRRLTELVHAMPDPPSPLPLSAKVIAVWTGEPAYLDCERRPRPMPRVAPDDEPSFERLVTSVTKDVRPRALLDEWLRQEMVVVKDDVVHLLRPAFLLTDGCLEKANFFGRNLRDHVAAGAHNLAGMEPPFFDRAVHYDRLTPESVEELRLLAVGKSRELLIEINQKASKLAARDREDGDGDYRFTLGVFFFSEPIDSRKDADIQNQETDRQVRIA